MKIYECGKELGGKEIWESSSSELRREDKFYRTRPGYSNKEQRCVCIFCVVCSITCACPQMHVTVQTCQVFHNEEMKPRIEIKGSKTGEIQTWDMGCYYLLMRIQTQAPFSSMHHQVDRLSNDAKQVKQ
eukprot:TRINITY_DN20014_c0_g1_i2.p1 TRINITY_DN20014_c0_g1~~TRINITY_DN20014_c0_g1_i2.p1  ORF type:complete len:129 (+),score=2.09 TRINITY_DN20014_c0_g1_i2:197-583(+)